MRSIKDKLVPREAAPILVYQAEGAVPASELLPVDAADLGSTSLEGDVRWSTRIDLTQDTVFGGVLQATRGKARVVHTGILQGTLHHGEIALIDEAGSHHLKAGDGFLVMKGTEVVWEIKSPTAQLSYLGDFAGVDAPAPLILYARDRAVPASELSSLGDPAALGVSFLEGEPVFGARVDHMKEGIFAGIFEATEGRYRIEPFLELEHGTILEHTETLIAPDGIPVTFEVGDSYMLAPGRYLDVLVRPPRMQISFIAIRKP